jgi:pentatricopeptide repeat protein
MMGLGLTPDHVSYSSVIHAHAHAGNPAAAQAWLDRMTQHGVRPDNVSFNSVCAAHAKVGDAAAAVACYQRMQNEGVCPSLRTHAILINALVRRRPL